jgi:hypothetical protein
MYYKLIKNYITPEHAELLVKYSLEFKKKHYTEENLANHSAYLSDKQPHRTSSAFAVSSRVSGLLPTIPLGFYPYPPTEDEPSDGCSLYYTTISVSRFLGVSDTCRMLFNIQEYFASSEPVPKHNDGELLNFTIEQDGSLDIKESIRPDFVAVLTLVNDTDGGGTRLHLPDGTTELVQAQAGDLLIFDNVNCLHSVDKLEGTVKRPDGLLRMIIGWRSLAE